MSATAAARREAPDYGRRRSSSERRPEIFGRASIRGLALLLLAASHVGEAAPPPDATPEPRAAEYAVRWDPAEGGLSRVADVIAFLGAPPAEGTPYDIRYFDLAPPDGAPPDSATILRQRRQASGASEIRLKFRRATPLPKGWSCPGGGLFRLKAEVDVSFSAGGPPSRVASYSCIVSTDEPPAFLAARPKPCASRMIRYDAGPFKVEEWTLPGGKRLLEISRSAKNDGEELARFGALVARLSARGVRPIDLSKTDAGSVCPADAAS